MPEPALPPRSSAASRPVAGSARSETISRIAGHITPAWIDASSARQCMAGAASGTLAYCLGAAGIDDSEILLAELADDPVTLSKIRMA